MRIVFFSHPRFLDSQSMMRFTSFLSNGMDERGHDVFVWMPEAVFFTLPVPQFIKKWMGYIDQYIVFRISVWFKIMQCPANTLFVFTDQALGPWVPWIGKRKHVIHCHDFLAQRSALDQIIENPTKWFGKQYQAYIRRGYRKGRNFISVSRKTQTDLHEFLINAPLLSQVVYNGLNQSFRSGDIEQARLLLTQKTNIDLTSGYILHIGGNQWYKNRLGVIEMYNAFRLRSNKNTPLLLIGQKPNSELLTAHEQSDHKDDIYFLTDIGDEVLKIAYSGASVFVFPSLAEGFGWPIAEAMTSGCLVITTNEAPMSEVAGDAGFLIARKPHNIKDANTWAINAGEVLNTVIELTANEREVAIAKGLKNAERFKSDEALDAIEEIYQTVIASQL